MKPPFSKTFFSIFYVLNSKNRVFNPYFFNWYLSNGKTALVDKSRVESKIVNEYDQEIPQSQTADNPVAP